MDVEIRLRKQVLYLVNPRLESSLFEDGRRGHGGQTAAHRGGVGNRSNPSSWFTHTPLCTLSLGTALSASEFRLKSSLVYT